MNDQTTKGRWTARLFVTGAILAVLGFIAGQAGVSPFGAMLAMTFGSLLLIIVAIMVIVRLLRQGVSSLSGLDKAALAIGLLAVLNTGRYMSGGGGPAIHDITTDLTDPPQFIAVAELRGPNENPAEYLDDGTAELQAEAYPDIRPVVLAIPPEAAFKAAAEAASAMGWAIVAQVPGEGRIEATASTPFVGFKDDVVIRVRPEGSGARVDVRSKSRVGKGDMGVNARRVREYSALLQDS